MAAHPECLSAFRHHAKVPQRHRRPSGILGWQLDMQKGNTRSPPLPHLPPLKVGSCHHDLQQAGGEVARELGVHSARLLSEHTHRQSAQDDTGRRLCTPTLV